MYSFIINNIPHPFQYHVVYVDRFCNECNILNYRFHRSVDYYKIYYRPALQNQYKDITISNEANEANETNQRVRIITIFQL